MYGSHVIWPPGCNVELQVGEAILPEQTVLLRILSRGVCV